MASFGERFGPISVAPTTFSPHATTKASLTLDQTHIKILTRKLIELAEKNIPFTFKKLGENS
jgi:hypothetical protein